MPAVRAFLPRPSVHPAAGTNSSPVGEKGTDIGEIGVGHAPQGVAIDPQTNLVYVPDDGGGVSVLDGSVYLTHLPVGSTPYAAVYDPVNNLTYVTDPSQNEVFVLKGTANDTSFSVPTSPLGLAVDPGTGLVYVADFGADKMTVINGTSVQASVAAGTSPVAVAYSSANGDVYVTDSGSNNVTVFNGTSRVATIHVGASPYGIAYEAVNQYLYVADNGGNQASIIYGTSVISTVSVGTAPDQVAADPLNGDVYITNEAAGENNVSVLSGLQVIGQVPTGAGPRGIAADPNTGVVYVADFDDNAVSQISTALWETAPVVADRGIAIDTTDVGQSISIDAQVLGPGSTGLTLSDRVQPSPGLGCAAAANLTSNPPGDTISFACRPTAVGVYTVYLNVSDSTGAKVWGSIAFAVDSGLVVPAPTIFAYRVQGLTIADVNQSVGLTVQPTGGSGIYTTFNWTGLGGALCTGLSTSHPSCRFPIIGGYNIEVSVVDSNLGFNQSGPSSITIYADPVAATPTANQTGADVTEAVTFSEVAAGGPGSYQYSWVGLAAAGCTNLQSASPSCSFNDLGEVNVSVVVTDPTGAHSTSPPLAFVVASLPTVADPTATRSVADVGQTVGFTTSATGGLPPYAFSWANLPPSCANLLGPRIHCTVTAPEIFEVVPSVVDHNGGQASATTGDQVEVNPDPTVAPPTLSSSSVVLGQGTLTIASDPVGGSGGFSYNWSGLPPGCSGHAAQIRCAPSAGGTYRIEVSVRDAAGYNVTSGAANLTVGSASVLSGVGGTFGVAAIGAAIAIVLAALVLLRLRRRRSGAPREPEPVSAEPLGPAGEPAALEGMDADLTEGAGDPSPTDAAGDGSSEPPWE